MPHLMQDPYPQIKSFIERELDHVAKLQTDLFSGRQSATAELDSALCSVDEQLSALERAVSSMVANPSKFNLSTNTAYQRQVEVENLRFQMSDWRRTCDQVKASSSKPSYTEIELGAQGMYHNATAQPCVPAWMQAASGYSHQHCQHCQGTDAHEPCNGLHHMLQALVCMP